MSTVASDAIGRIGGIDSPLTVFQDFFVDVDFPVFLTRNDTVEFPVIVYNYLEEDQVVTLQVQEEPWFDLLEASSVSLKLGPGEVRGTSFPVRVKKVGWHAMTVIGKGSKGLADAVQRTVEVRSDGREELFSQSGKFKSDDESPVQVPLSFPSHTIEGSARARVQILPGLTSHVVQGMDSMLRLPGG